MRARITARGEIAGGRTIRFGELLVATEDPLFRIALVFRVGRDFDSQVVHAGGAQHRRDGWFDGIASAQLGA